VCGDEVGHGGGRGLLHLEPQHVHVHDDAPLLDVQLLLNRVQRLLRVRVAHGHVEQLEFLGVPVHRRVECLFVLLESGQDQGRVGLRDVFRVF